MKLTQKQNSFDDCCITALFCYVRRFFAHDCPGGREPFRSSSFDKVRCPNCLVDLVVILFFKIYVKTAVLEVAHPPLRGVSFDESNRTKSIWLVDVGNKSCRFFCFVFSCKTKSARTMRLCFQTSVEAKNPFLSMINSHYHYHCYWSIFILSRCMFLYSI